MEEEMAIGVGAGGIARVAYKVQMRLLSLGDTNEEEPLGQEVTEPHLAAAAWVLSRADYADVVTERSIAGLCGFPLCREAPTSLSQNKEAPSRRRGAKFHVSLSEHRVYDLTECAKFCSDSCLLRSKAYEASLPDCRPSSALFDLTKPKRQELAHLFSLSSSSASYPSSSSVSSSSTATTSTSTATPSLISIQDKADSPVPFDVWLGPPDAIEGYVPRSKPNSKSQSHPDANSNSQSDPQHDDISTMFSSIILDNTTSKSNSQSDPLHDDISTMFQSIILDDTTNNNNITKTRTQATKTLPKPHSSNLKSSLNKEPSTSAPRTRKRRSIRWADQQPSNAPDTILSSEEHATASSPTIAPPQASAATVIAASDILSSGNSAVDDAMLDAQIVMLPQLSYETEKEPHENREDDVQENRREVVKWPQKPVLLETDMFEVDDSWHDAPPEGFNLDLSPFCTIWMAVFGWVTRSTLCYIYGQDESLSEQFSEVEGREYPQKVVLKDGQSAEIRKALDGFVGRALPSLVLDLRLPVPVSTLEKYLGRLLDTMTFAEALPALRMKQWHAVVLLFLDALSVHHLPSLSSIMANRSLLLNKVLNGAQMEADHYDSMINLFIPLGRSPSLSFQKSCE